MIDQDLHRRATTPYRAATSNIYRCADGKFFQTHGSFNPDPVLDLLGLPHDIDVASPEEAWTRFQKAISQINSADLLHAIENARQAGHKSNSFEEYTNSEHGKNNTHVGLFELHHIPNVKQLPSWWPSTNGTSSSRPLTGLKVVDLTRVIAGPTVTRGLAELGASVMRVISPNIPDWVALHIDLNWGKWNTYLALENERDRQQLRRLIQEADVVVNGYRPGAFDKYGFSQENIIELVANRKRGIVYVRENTYGWHGPFKHRPGWQPTSDACAGISHGYGKALGLDDDEPAMTLFPNSDYSTGLAGVSAILSAILQRGEKGGSYSIDLALNYYNQWLIRSCGVYPQPVWNEMWEKYDKFQFRAINPMEVSAPITMKLMHERSDSFRDEFFEVRHNGILGVDIRCVKPVIQFPNGEVVLKYNVGCRGNGTDAPRWPEDLMTEKVT
jgi:CoA-transferase family III